MAQATPGNLELTISVPKEQFAAGEPIPVAVSLRNVSADGVMVNARLAANDTAVPGPLRDLTFQITKPSGAQASFNWDIRIGYPHIGDFVVLAADEVVERTIQIDDLYALDEPGMYEVCAMYENAMVGPVLFDDTGAEPIEQDLGALRGPIASNCLNLALSAAESDPASAVGSISANLLGASAVLFLAAGLGAWAAWGHRA
jgi:hypothetical protein